MAKGMPPRGPGGPGRGPRHDFRKPKDIGGTVRKLLRYLSRYKLQLVLVALCLVVSSLCSVGGSYLLKPIINDYIVPGDYAGLVKMLVVMALVYITGSLCSFAYARVMVRISQSTTQAIRRDLFKKMHTFLLRMPISRMWVPKNLRGILIVL